MHAGTLLWRGSALPELLSAWAGVIATLGNSVSSSIGVLHVPPTAPLPDILRGTAAVHLAIADPDGPAAAAPLLEALRAAAPPVVDNWGPTDAAGLARIHLDPPSATPAIGDARWLDESTPAIAEALLSTGVADDAPIAMMEIRHVAGAPQRRPGAVVAPAGSFIYHAVAPLDRFGRERIEDGFARARTVWTVADTGLTPGSWIEGAATVPSALPDDIRKRARSIADAVDPAGRIHRSRLLG